MAGNSTNGRKPKQSLGFLTVLECPRDGLFGGYLVLNPLGRPLEFHCTAPIRPNRAQQILYGPTLDAYLFGEQIGHSLIKGASHAPLAIFTDHPAVMALRELVDLPLALVEHPPSGVDKPNPPAAPNVAHPPSGVSPPSRTNVAHPPSGVDVEHPPSAPNVAHPPSGVDKPNPPSRTNVAHPPSGVDVEHPPAAPNVAHPPSGVATDSSQPGAARLQADAGAKTWRIHAAHAADSTLRHFHWGQNRLAASSRAQADEAAILERLAELSDSFDLSEPFVRIREAIAEARASGGD